MLVTRQTRIVFYAYYALHVYIIRFLLRTLETSPAGISVSGERTIEERRFNRAPRCVHDVRCDDSKSRTGENAARKGTVYRNFVHRLAGLKTQSNNGPRPQLVIRRRADAQSPTEKFRVPRRQLQRFAANRRPLLPAPIFPLALVILPVIPKSTRTGPRRIFPGDANLSVP